MQGLEEKGKNAMELARHELDFARTAKEAPSSKEILRKSQTFVPMAPPQPWGKRLAQTGAVLAAVALVFAPWIPRSAVISSVIVQFDQVQTEAQAQELAYGFLNHLPPELLMGADFQATPADVEDTTGQLTLRVSGMQRFGKLEQATRKTLQAAEVETGSSLILPGISVKSTAWQSPVELAAGLTSRHETEANSKIDPSLPLAQAIISNQHLLYQGLADYLAKQGFTVSDFGLLDSMSGALPARFDFMIADSWPRNFGVTINGYHELTGEEQQLARQYSSDFLQQLNLHQPSVILGKSLPGSQLLRVQVVDSSARINSYLSNRLQAEIEQPSNYEVASYSFDPAVTIEAAMLHALPKAEYELDTAPMLDEARQTCGFWITVTITGLRSNGITDRTMQEIELNVDIEL